MEEGQTAIRITKKMFDKSDKPYRVQRPAEYGGYGDGRQVSINGVYNYLKNFVKDREGRKVSDLEMLQIIGSNMFVAIDSVVMTELTSYINERSERAGTTEQK